MDTKIANVPLKKILQFVSRTDISGFDRGDLNKGLKLDNLNITDQIFGFLKQEDYIQHIGGNSPFYRKTSKVVSELNSLKQWFDKPVGQIIVGVFITIIGALILKYTVPTMVYLVYELNKII
ncbi:MAG: hypothetical protein WCT26_02695 [Candidatus Buchananbacteria bacterium]|jgi:hypothetical protein